jgi:hypothetical protein
MLHHIIFQIGFCDRKLKLFENGFGLGVESSSILFPGFFQGGTGS